MISSPTGKIDSFANGTLSGWAIHPDTDTPALYCSIDGRIVRKFTTDLDRPDVAQYFGIGLVRTGFHIDVSADISAAKLHAAASDPIVICVTFDADVERHLEDSPIIQVRAETTALALQFVGPARIALARAQAGQVAVDGPPPDARLSLHFEDLEWAFEAEPAPGQGPTWAIDPSQNLVLAHHLELLAAHSGGAKATLSASVVTIPASGAMTVEVALHDLAGLMLYLAAWRDRNEPAGVPSERFLLAALGLLEQQLRLRNYARLLGTIRMLQRLMPDLAVRNALVARCRTLLARLWELRLWGAYARMLEALTGKPELFAAVADQGHLGSTLRVWAQGIKFVSGYPSYFEHPDRFGGHCIEALGPLVKQAIATGTGRDAQLLNEEWALSCVLPSIARLSAHPELLCDLLSLDVRGRHFRATGGRGTSLAQLTAHNPALEQVFLSLEELATHAKRVLAPEVLAHFEQALTRALAPSPVLQNLLSTLLLPGAVGAAFDPESVERAATTFLIYSSRLRRCEMSRLQALDVLSQRADTWKPKYHAEKARYADVYSFECQLVRPARVHMLQSHEALLSSMYQVPDDLAPLMDLEGATAFACPETIIFDAINLGHTNLVGGLVRSLIDVMSANGERGYAVFAPWLSLGGADAYCCTAANILLERGRVTIYTTEQDWRDGVARLKAGVKLVDLSAMFKGHSEEDIEFALAMAIEAVDPGLILNFNSRRLWSTLSKFHHRLGRGRGVGAMFFCDDYDAAGKLHSYLRNHAGVVARGKIAAIGDSGPYFDSVCQAIGIPQNRRVPMHFPPLATVRSARTKQTYERTGRVMWSGRFDTQKRIDIATSLASMAPHIEFHVYGFPMLDSDETLVAALNAQPNVVNFGKYDSFGEIDIDQYDALVITTQWEGCPNVVLEAGLRGLSVVAPDVGGIGEALGGGRGFLSTSTFDDVDALAEQLLLCCADREGAKQRAMALRDYVNATHTDADVLAGIRKIEAME